MIEQDILKQFNLPSYIKNSSFSQASEKIKSKFLSTKGNKNDLREDRASKETMEELLGRLASAQEFIKMQEALKNESQQVPDLMDGAIPEGMEEFAGGGFMNFLGNNGTAIGVAGQGIGMTGQAAAGENTVIAGDPNDNATVDSIKDTVSGALGPIGQAFRGIQKAGQGIGDAIGGDTGAVVSGLFSPEEGTIANWKDEDLNIGEKLLGTIPGVGGLIAKNSAHKKAQKVLQHSTIGDTMAYNSDFAYGGKVNKMQDGGIPSNLDKTFSLNPFMLDASYTSGKDILRNRSAIPVETVKSPTINERPTRDSFLSSAGKFIGNNIGGAAQLAPIASNILELSNLKKATTQRGSRLDNVYRPEQFDEASLVNQINQDNTNRAITEASGGDLGALRSNLIASGANKTKALSDAMLQGQNINREENRFAFQSGLSKDSMNVQLDQDYLNRAAQDEAAYETTKSNLKRALAEDIGKVGREREDKQLVKRLFGYTWNGKYYVDDKGKRVPNEDINKALENIANAKKTTKEVKE